MMAEKIKSTLTKPTVEGLAALLKKLTGKEPDMDKLRAGLGKV